MLPGTELAISWDPAIGIPTVVVGVIVLVLVWLFGQPKKEQGTRRPAPEPGAERREPRLGDAADEGDAFRDISDERIDPRFSSPTPHQGELDVGLSEELEKLSATLADERHATIQMPKPTGHAASIVEVLRSPSQPEYTAATMSGPSAAISSHAPASTAHAPAAPTPAPAPRIPPRSDLGKRPTQVPVERIVSLFVVAREGHAFNGADLIVAAEKAGLEYGDMGIYHRLVDGKRELGPIFSVANMLKPGSFDLTRLDALRTPGLSFFMALPGPVAALDAWDAMLPTAQRLAELLDGQVLDEERNALGRQRIAHIRDELRGWDREHDGGEIRFGR
ncbi:cell division protein ZipA [Dyella psychrodurans]|uniref:Cell division protein ZipA n=1 Tax=Dyella psychrodurans TaxID=1927960 RepID=A0A370XDK1_9GAMM|nr:cell division protein ZipA [Dyella psychrodurans]RDS86459.1 cell division protein ZipA [Dyella psychrodurans]